MEQSWIKGVNSSGLVAEKDMGKDGATVGPNQSVARDALGYTLSYFNGDYQQIGNTPFELQTNGSQLNDAKSLYNGNIRYMSIHNKGLGEPMAFSYEYDQLHRIRQMTSVDNADLTNFSWGASGNVSKYGMAATYDGNGNILKLNRDGILPDKTRSERVNDLTYDYLDGTNLLVGTTESVVGEACKDDEIVDYPITVADSIKSINRIFSSSTINGEVDIKFKTGQRICLEPGFKMEGIGGRFAALTQQLCEDTGSGEPIASKYLYDGNGNMILNGDSVMIEWTPYGKVRNVVHLKAEEGQSSGDNMNIVVEEPIVEDEVIQACSTIVANSTVIGEHEVLFEAGESITLLPGFQANPLGAGVLTIRVLEDMIDCEAVVYDPPESTFGYDAAQNRVVKSEKKEDVLSKTFYIRDVHGNMMATYTERRDSLTWKEQHLYGSGRLGVIEPKVVLTEQENRTDPHFETTGLVLAGWKRYELSNHLGNVLAVVNDRKLALDENGDRQADHYEATILSASDYYPFGMEMPSRSYTNTTFSGLDYRFGFNGKEADRNGEWGSSSHYDYGFRIYDPSIARFLSVDPLMSSYPWYTPFQFAGNMPIWAIDIDGLEPGKVTGGGTDDCPNCAASVDVDDDWVTVSASRLPKGTDKVTNGGKANDPISRAIYSRLAQGDNNFNVNGGLSVAEITLRSTYADPMINIAFYGIGGTLGGMGLAKTGLLLNTTFEVGASYIVNGDLSGVDAADIATGVGFGKYTFLVQTLLGGAFDLKFEEKGYSSAFGWFGGTRKGGLAIAIDFGVSSIGKGLELGGKKIARPYLDKGNFIQTEIKASHSYFTSKLGFDPEFNKILNSSSAQSAQTLLKKGNKMESYSEYFSQGTTSILDDAVGRLTKGN